jgi:hypothetical protein
MRVGIDAEMQFAPTPRGTNATLARSIAERDAQQNSWHRFDGVGALSSDEVTQAVALRLHSATGARPHTPKPIAWARIDFPFRRVSRQINRSFGDSGCDHQARRDRACYDLSAVSATGRFSPGGWPTINLVAPYPGASGRA